MQFRERRRVIQVIRTVYDPRIKRGRSEVVGNIDRDAPLLDDALRAACSDAETAEVEAYIAILKDEQSRQAAAEAAAALPAQMRLSEGWLRLADGKEDVGPLAAEIWTAWEDLSKALHKAGVGKSKHKN
jgi:hypothetical protein